MWEINNTLQLLGFLRAAVLGGFFCIFYDFLRSVRKLKSYSGISVFFQDVFYFVVISPITFCYMLAITNGELRAYIFIALIIGFLGVRFTVSFIVLRFFILILTFVIKIIRLLNKLFNIIFNKLHIVLSFLAKKFQKIALYLKKYLKKA